MFAASTYAMLISCEANALSVDTMKKFMKTVYSCLLTDASKTLTFSGWLLKPLLTSYINKDGQPAIEFLKAVSILDVARVCIISHYLKDYRVIPVFQCFTRQVSVSYTHLTLPTILRV